MVAQYGMGPTSEAGAEDWDRIWQLRLQRQRDALARANQMGLQANQQGGAARAQAGASGAGVMDTGAGVRQARLQGVIPMDSRVYDSVISSTGSSNRSIAENNAIQEAAAASGEGASDLPSAPGQSDIPRPVGDNRYGNNDPLQATGLGGGNSRWTSSIPDASLEQLSQQPGRWGTRYALSNDYGMGVERLLNNSVDPNAAWMLTLGTDAADQDPFSKMETIGAMYDDAFDFDRSLGGGFAPQDIITSVFGASGGPEGSYIGQALYGGANEGNWGGQVEESLRFIESAMRGRLAPEVLGPYLDMLAREGDMFLAWKDQNPTAPGNFGQWVLDRLGPTGGL
jgi:hypothetical protein